jgi:hypothetical protein
VFVRFERWQFGAHVLGAILWLVPWLAFCLGSGLRACIVNQPHSAQFLAAYTALISFGGVVTYWQIAALLTIAGLATTFYFRLKPLVILLLILGMVALVTGYFMTLGGGCAVVG